MIQFFFQINQLAISRINLIAILFCAVSSFLWIIFLANWYYFRYTGGWDTAYFIQTLSGLLKGNFSPSVLDGSFVSDHCHFFAFLIAPLYWIFPEPILLQYIKLGAFFGGAYVFFLILKKYIHPWMAFLAMAAFTVNPANVAMLRFAFSYESLAIPLIFLIFKAFDDRKYGLYIGCCFLLVLVKEQMPLVVMFFGVLAFILRREEWVKWALVPFLLGLTVFLVEVFVLLPIVREKAGIHQLIYWSRYKQFGKTPSDIIVFLLTHPGRVWMECFSGTQAKWFAELGSVWGGMAFFSPAILIPAIPLYLKMALSSEPVEHSVTSVYYASVFTPFLFLAAWHTCNYFKDQWRDRMQMLALVLMFLHAANFIPLWSNDPVTPLSANVLATQRFIDQIPPDASVLSSRRAMTHLANRDKLYAVKDYLKGRYYISGKPFVLSDNVQYMLIDFSEFIDQRYVTKVADLNFDKRFAIKESIEDVTLFIKKDNPASPGRPLIERRKEPPYISNNKPIVFKDLFTYEGMLIPKRFPSTSRIFNVTMFWKSLKKVPGTYEVMLSLRRGNQMLYQKRKNIGSTIYPTNQWREKEYIKEDYYYLLPRLTPGQYEVYLQVFDAKTRQMVSCKGSPGCEQDAIIETFTVY